MRSEARVIAWIGVAAAGVTAIVAVAAYLWPRSTPEQASHDVDRRPSAGTTAGTADPDSVAGSGGGDATSGSTDDRYVLEYADTVFTMPDPGKGSCTADTVTFGPEGPVADTVWSALVADYISGDLFYDSCNTSDEYRVTVPNEDAFTSISGEPDAATCAGKATRQPIRRTLVFSELKPGASYCLVTTNHQVAYVTLTALSGHDLSWKATAWRDTADE